MKNYIIMGLTLVSLSACATISPELRAKLDAISNEPTPKCTGELCTEMWSRAQIWVSKNAAMKLQIATDSVLQTFNPGTNPVYQMTVTKEALGSGNYRIEMDLRCGNIFGCGTNPQDVANMFYHYVNTGEDLAKEFHG